MGDGGGHGGEATPVREEAPARTTGAAGTAPWKISSWVRLAVAVIVAIYALTYSPPPGAEAPAYLMPLTLAIAACLGALAMIQWSRARAPETGLGLGFLAADVLGPVALLWLYAFDGNDQLFVLLFVAMAQGALLFRWPGALATWAISASAYVAAQPWAEQGASEDDVLLTALRVFLMLMIAVVIAELTRSLESGAQARKLAEEHVRYQADLLQHVTDAVVAVDPDLMITSWNAGAEHMYGFAEEEALGRPLEKILGPHLAAIAIQHHEWKGEVPHLTRDGRHIEIEATGIPLDDGGELRGYLMVNRDVTERRRAQDAAERARLSEDANRAKNDFLSRVSHELRTPLNAILGFAQLLSMEDLTSEQRANVIEVMSGGEHLLTLINDVLEISRIESNELELDVQPFSAGEEIRDAVRMLAFQAREQGIRLETDDEGSVGILADPHRFRQIVLNLISNAVKYNRPRGKVRVGTGRGADGAVRVWVEDTGMGIKPEDLDRLFIPFERLGAERTEIQGTGLGLALCKELAEAMGGSIGVSSERGVGTTFWVDLPPAAIPPQQAERPLEPTAPASSKARRVLYIEDDPGNYRLMRAALSRRASVELTLAQDGLTGVQAAIDGAPDLILLDIHLPDIQGDEVLRRLQDDPHTATIPVVAVSADATDQQRQRILSGGAVEYLLKPINVIRLLEIIDGLPAAGDA